MKHLMPMPDLDPIARAPGMARRGTRRRPRAAGDDARDGDPGRETVGASRPPARSRRARSDVLHEPHVSQGRRAPLEPAGRGRRSTGGSSGGRCASRATSRRSRPRSPSPTGSTRPRGSQIAAWASPQSRPLADRAALDALVEEAEQRFADEDVPLPAFWGGYRLVPDSIELWTHRDDRLHDRVLYVREGRGWRSERLAP